MRSAPAFTLLPGAETKGIRKIAWVDGPAPLRSGWALGQKYLNGVTEILQAPVGKGMLVLYGPDPYFRSQRTERSSCFSMVYCIATHWEIK